ncbi:MAG: hypothetical protein IPI69_01400 [Bacteroidales bacterium]|nr:hypothetical protein [Bacteroidales bacterium]
MKITCLNVKYISGKPHQYFEDFKEPMPSTRAIAWCMARTEVARLFSRDDMHEFLFRLPILFHIRGLVEDWLMDGTLFNYWFRGREYTSPLMTWPCTAVSKPTIITWMSLPGTGT